MAEINYLCVHSKLRNKRIAPALIAEVTRRVNLKETWQAIYTAGVEIPKPITTARYFHRNLNVKRLIDFKFTGIKPGSTLSANIKLYKLPDSTSIQGVRKMTKKDSKAVHELLTNYLLKFPIHQEFSYEEVVRNLVPKEGVIYSYVVENSEKQITDFISFYSLPSQVLHLTPNQTLEAAYSYYTVPGQHSLKDLYKDALVLAKLEGFDVFNCLNIMDNSEVLDELKFGSGDGSLHYYLYNYLVNGINPSDLGVVLV